MTLEISDEAIRGVEVGDARVGLVTVEDEMVGSVSLLDFLIALGAIVELGGGAMIGAIRKTFGHADFVLDNGSYVAPFDAPLPDGAFPIGLLIEVISAFDAGLQIITTVSAAITPVDVVDLFGQHGQVGTNFGPGSVLTAQIMDAGQVPADPTQGSVRVTILYLDPLAFIEQTFTFADLTVMANGISYRAPFAAALPNGAIVESIECEVTQVFTPDEVEPLYPLLSVQFDSSNPFSELGLWSAGEFRGDAIATVRQIVFPASTIPYDRIGFPQLVANYNVPPAGGPIAGACRVRFNYRVMS